MEHSSVTASVRLPFSDDDSVQTLIGFHEYPLINLRTVFSALFRVRFHSPVGHRRSRRSYRCRDRRPRAERRPRRWQTPGKFTDDPPLIIITVAVVSSTHSDATKNYSTKAGEGEGQEQGAECPPRGGDIHYSLS